MRKAKLDLERIVFIGRTFDEYLRMFDLRPEELAGRRILDCPSGACSFTAVANRLGARVVAADIAYNYPVGELLDKGLKDIEHALRELDKVRDNYVWNDFASIDNLEQTRFEALAVSTGDRERNSGRYIPVELPRLPFEDACFDLTLSAHFLFMYSDRLDYEFHLQTLLELMRVTTEEIRIFPLVDLSSRRYEALDRLILEIGSMGWRAEELRVPYEFQKGANTMLRITRI
jgi:hypothetical protein